jgi:hypothetical protein
MKSFKQFINEQLSFDDLDDLDDFGDDLNLFPDSLSNLEKLSEKDVMFYKNLIASDLEYDNELAEAGLNNEGIAIEDFIELMFKPGDFFFLTSHLSNDEFSYILKNVNVKYLTIFEEVLLMFNRKLAKLGYSFCSSAIQIKNHTFVLCNKKTDWRLVTYPNNHSIKRIPPPPPKSMPAHMRRMSGIKTLPVRVQSFHKKIKTSSDYREFLIWAITFIIENIDNTDSELRTRKYTNRIKKDAEYDKSAELLIYSEYKKLGLSAAEIHDIFEKHSSTTWGGMGTIFILGYIYSIIKISPKSIKKQLVNRIIKLARAGTLAIFTHRWKAGRPQKGNSYFSLHDIHDEYLKLNKFIISNKVNWVTLVEQMPFTNPRGPSIEQIHYVYLSKDTLNVLNYFNFNEFSKKLKRTHGRTIPIPEGFMLTLCKKSKYSQTDLGKIFNFLIKLNLEYNIQVSISIDLSSLPKKISKDSDTFIENIYDLYGVNLDLGGQIDDHIRFIISD